MNGIILVVIYWMFFEPTWLKLLIGRLMHP